MLIIFYKIQQNDNPNEFYIGSCMNFKRRKYQHKKNTTNKTKKSYWNNLYFHIRLKGGWDNFTMTILYEILCDGLVRKQYEQSFIDLMKPSLNSINVLKLRDENELSEIIKKLKELNL